MNFPERMNVLRKQKKMTMEELGKALGVGKSTIASYEGGGRRPPLERMQEIATYFGVSTDYLIGITDDPTPKFEQDLFNLLKNKPDFHYKGKPVSKRDLEFLINYLDRILEEEEHNTKETTKECNNQNS